MSDSESSNGLTEGLRMELADTDVKVSCFQPGLVMTDLHNHMEVHPKEASGMDTPLTPKDVAECVMFMLTSRQASSPEWHSRHPAFRSLPCVVLVFSGRSQGSRRYPD